MPRAPELIEFELSQLPSGFTPKDLKQLCPTVHIVSAAVSNNIVSGEALGSGRVTIRTDGKSRQVIDQFRVKLLGRGIQAKQQNAGQSKNTLNVRWLNRDYSRRKPDPARTSFFPWQSVLRY